MMNYSLILIILSTILALSYIPVSHSNYSVYVPNTVTNETAATLRTLTNDPNQDPSTPSLSNINGWKKLSQNIQASGWAKSKHIIDIFKPNITNMILGGVPVYDVKPHEWIDNGKVLVYVHGGLSVASANSTLKNAVIMANATGLKVVSVDYVHNPFSKWEEATDQVISVIQTLRQQNYSSGDISLYGGAGGGLIGSSAILKMRDQGMGMIGKVVLLSPWVDLTEAGDTFNTLKSKDPIQSYSKQLKVAALAYADSANMKDPYISPVYANFSKGFPPTLIQGGTKEIFLSGFIRFYQALDQAKIPAKLDLYEGMFHSFQVSYYKLPESKIALEKVKDFLTG